MKRIVVVIVGAGMLLSTLALSSTSSGASPREDWVDVIVQLRSGEDAVAVSEDHSRLGARVGTVFQRLIDGYAARLPESLVSRIQADSRVLTVEIDHEVHATDQDVPPGIERVGGATRPSLVNATDDVNVDVDVAVLDTGIDASHPDLNVVYGVNCLSEPRWWWGWFPPAENPCQSGGTADGDSHGTHVAGIIGALDNDIGVVGIAPGARLWNVKVLDDSGSGSISGIIRGLEWVAERVAQIEVVNMSLGCQCQSSALGNAIEEVVDLGIVVVASAGNESANISGAMPGGHPDAIGVSAMADYDGQPGGSGSGCATPDDTRASFSNYGAGVDMTAPGVCVVSTVPGGGYGSKSGTSMSSPHVAGAAALLASADNPNGRSDVLAIRSTLLSNGTFDWIDTSGDGVTEPLLNVAPSAFDPSTVPGSEDPPAGNQPPTASFTVSCDDLTCTFDASGSSDDAGIVTYDWDFGDGNGAPAGDEVEVHAYASQGDYTVELTVADGEGEQDSTTRTAQPTDPPVNQPPTASFTVSCDVMTCSFDASGSSDDGGIVSYAWDFGDSSSTTEGDPSTSHTYASEGAFTVELTVTDGGGLDDSTTRTAAPNDADPVASFTVSCNLLTCSFNASGSSDDGGIVSYAWDFGDSSSTTEGDPSTSHTYASEGSFTVELTVTDGSAQTDSTTRTASPVEPPAVTITIDVDLQAGFFLDRYDISWAGATTANVDIRRDGSIRSTTVNDGQFTDYLWFNSSAHTWQVCNQGSTTECSPIVVQ